MKRPGLTLQLASATLFLAFAATGLPAQQKASGPFPDRMAELVHRFDKDGDGKLDDEERAEAREIMIREQREKQRPQAAAPGAGGPEGLRARLLEQFDRNKDGQLDEEERAAAQKFMAERGFGPDGTTREELIRRFDRNGNGQIDPDEREEIAAFARERMAQGRGGEDRAAREKAELENVLRTAVETNAALLRRFDANRNGKLDDEEWATVRRQLDR